MLAAGQALGSALAAGPPSLTRVILDNDFAGDPDGLFQLAHHVLCRSVEIPLIVGSHLPGRFGSRHDAADGAARAREVLALMGLADRYRTVAGAEAPIASRSDWRPGPATAAIVREAMRDDRPAPLHYAAGAGLTELALAWLAEPRIGRRVRLVWIGGHDPAAQATPGRPEFNFSIDPLAAQIVFNESDIEIWQVPQETYRQMLFSNAELEELAATGPLGAYLKARVDAVPAMLVKIPGGPKLGASDAYVLGDSPLVTLTAFLTPIDPDTTSSPFRIQPAPRLLADGRCEARADGRPMRVYSGIDAGLTFRDMLARFRLHAATHPA